MNYYFSVMLLGLAFIALLVAYRRVKDNPKYQLQLWINSNVELETGSQKITGPFNSERSLEMLESVRNKFESKYSFLNAQCMAVIGKNNEGTFSIYWTVYHKRIDSDTVNLYGRAGRLVLKHVFAPLGLRSIYNTSVLSPSLNLRLAPSV